MAAKTARFMLSIPKELAQRAERLADSAVLGRSHAQTYRNLIQLGIEKIEEAKLPQGRSAFALTGGEGEARLPGEEQAQPFETLHP